jgi:hypothetical protein
MKPKLIPILITFLLAGILGLPSIVLAQTKKPNILVIWGDDIGLANISAYSSGVMGYETPNIDRIAKEGIRFLQYYGEQSCTAGRSAFLTPRYLCWRWQQARCSTNNSSIRFFLARRDTNWRLVRSWYASA